MINKILKQFDDEFSDNVSLEEERESIKKFIKKSLLSVQEETKQELLEKIRGMKINDERILLDNAR